LGALPEDEEEAAVRAFPKICKDEKTFRTITRHLNLGSVVEFSDEQKLTIYREYKRLEAISLESWKGKYRFNVLVPAEPRIWTRSGGFRTMPDPERNEGFRVEGTVDFDGQVTILKKEEVVLKCPALRCVGRRP